MALRHDPALLDYGQVKQKRARGQLSCTPCRVGKLKCNRLRDPACDQCIKRGREAACHYVPPPAKTKPPTNVKGRIKQLESLVLDLMVQQNQQPASTADQPTPPSDSDAARQPQRPKTNIDANVEASLGKLAIGREEVAYTGENHWQTILSSLSDLQKDLGDEEKDNAEESSPERNDTSIKAASPPDATPASQTSFILGNTKIMSKDELISKVPEKRTVDRLLSLWFNSPDTFKLIIHAPTFQEEYKRFWENPQEVPTMWIGLLFAILCLAESFGLRNSPPSSIAAGDCMERVQHYQSLTASAAVLAEYTKPKEYTVETLLLYMVGLRNENAAMNAWIVMGIIVRIALRMGYHRDPGHYPKITAFQAEMRRRVWTLTNMIDVFMSFGLGLPSMVRTVASDTKPPANLLDRDFTRHMAFLPPGRGEHELTPSLYIRSKLKMMQVFAQAAELSHATSPPSYETIQALAVELEQAKADLPPALQMPDISELVTDPAEQLMFRFNIDLLYSKCRIVLFRRYMLVPLSELSDQEQINGIGAGRDACIKSARKVLDHHYTIYNAIQPGGQLENMRWYMGSIAVHDFLLAAMVVCLELSQQLERDKMLRISNGMECPSRQAMLRALKRSYEIWIMSSDEVNSTIHSDHPGGYAGGDMHEETKKASKAMAGMLARIRAQESRKSEAESAPAGTAKASVFDENGHEYFRNLGVTPASARTTRMDGYYGVLTTYDWGNIPDDFQFGKAPTPYSSTSGGPNQSIDGLTQGPSIATGRTDFDMSDPMHLDWQAFDNEIFNVVDQDMAMQQDYDLQMLNPGANDPLQADSLPNTSGLQFSVDDMQNIDLGTGNYYTSFIDNEKSAAWTRNPR